MATTIITKYGSGAPTTSDVVRGELAVDTENGRLYTLNSSNAVVEIGVNAAANTTFGDNVKAIFGDGSDLQIYHDGGTSIIADTGTGFLALRGDGNVTLQNAAGTENKLVASSDGAVTLYYDNSAKLATTSTGIDVTGTVTADGLTVDGGTYHKVVSTFPSTYTTNLRIGQQGNINNDASADEFLFNHTGTSTASNTLFKINSKNVLNIDEGGDISFYEDTGTTAKFFWDASAESLGIGTSSPDYNFHVTGTGDTIAAVTAGASSVAGLNLGNSTNKADGGIRYDNSADALIFRASNAEKMRIDSSGNLLVSTINDTPGLGDTDVGASFRADGASFVSRTLSDTSGSTLYVNRNTYDGNLVQFQKDGTTVGSIGTAVGYLTAGTGDTGLLFNSADDAVQPWNISTNSARDASIDLGRSTHRFKNLYLSGNAYADNFIGTNDTDTFIAMTGSDLIRFFTGNTERLRISDIGELTSTPTYNNTTAAAANMYIASNAKLYRSTSSARYKNTIQDASFGLSEAMSLRPVTYKGNNDGDVVYGGLIAEEVHDAGLTQFVQYDKEGRPDSLAYGNMVSLCIKAIQEQQDLIESLTARIAALEGAN